MASREKLTESIRTLLTERGLGNIAPKLLSDIDELVMMSQYHGVDIEAEVEYRINELNTKQSTRKDDMELVQLTNKIITGIELLAEDYNAVPGCPDYAKKLRRMSKVLAKPESLIDINKLNFGGIMILDGIIHPRQSSIKYVYYHISVFRRDIR